MNILVRQKGKKIEILIDFGRFQTLFNDFFSIFDIFWISDDGFSDVENAFFGCSDDFSFCFDIRSVFKLILAVGLAGVPTPLIYQSPLRESNYPCYAYLFI